MAATLGSARRYRLSGPQSKDLLAPVGGTGDSDDELVKLQALIAQWLRMENVLVLLGAGASITAGGKTLGALESTVLKFLLSYYDKKGDAELTAFVRGRQTKVASGGAIGFESWLSQLVGALTLQTAPSSVIESVQWRDGISLTLDKLKLLLADLRKAIFIFCALNLPPASTTPSAHHSFFTKLLSRDPSLGRTRVFTLNYDTLIEQALDHLGVHYWDGFVGKAIAKFDPSSYALDLYYPGEVAEGRVRRYDKFLHLYKLHGSVHWWETTSQPGLKAFHPPLAPFDELRTQFASTSTVAPADFERVSQLLPGQVGILPTATKYVETLDLPYAHLFRIFHQSLQLPQSFLLVSGYGFGDEHVNRILEDALVNPSFVMLVTDPAPNTALRAKVENYQLLGARVYLLEGFDPPAGAISPATPATFDDLATNVLPNVAWLEEWVRTQKLANSIRSTSLKA